MKRLALSLTLFLAVSSADARDFENGYAVYAAGAESCRQYTAAEQQGGAAYDYYLNWLIGYLSAFNVIVPNTYDILGENEFSMVQSWLSGHCGKFPNEMFVNATARMTEVLYPTRYQSSLKQPPQQAPSNTQAPEQTQPQPQRKFSDIKIR